MLKVVKIGGNVVDNPQKLECFLKDFASIEGDKILVHGGGKIATTISKALGIEAQMIGGRRVTDEQTLKVVTMVYAGVVNKGIVAQLAKVGAKSFGLCGADGATIVSNRRSPEPIDFGFVGDPDVDKISTRALEMLLGEGYLPVIAPITMDSEGQLLNTNADTVAQSVAVAISKVMPVELVYCFEKRGVLADVEDEDSVIERIDKDLYEQLKESGVIVDGMLPKMENAFRAIDAGVSSVVICSSDSIAQKGYSGTTLVK